MHVQRLKITNMRSIREFELSLKGIERAGWHVILGDNGSGKSTIVRALAIALMGQSSAQATRQDWSRWLGKKRDPGVVSAVLIGHSEDRWTGSGRKGEPSIYTSAQIRAESLRGKQTEGRATIQFRNRQGKRTIWGHGFGWFSASFGPFRRFSGGDPKMDRLFVSHPLLAPHLSAFGENIALGESLLWLQELETKKLEGNDEAAAIQGAVINFINNSELLPHGAHIANVSSEKVDTVDGHGTRVAVEEMSDGYRSILSLTLEILRLLFSAFGSVTALNSIDPDAGTISLPGVISIDEIDAHLHPTWQQYIGEWFVSRFPKMQFIVTTHSPIICRAARYGSVWLLPAPDSGQEPRRIVDTELDRLVDGNILDAYGTELFGAEVTRSKQAKEKLDRLASLNRKRLKVRLSAQERSELDKLRRAMPSNASATS